MASTGPGTGVLAPVRATSAERTRTNQRAVPVLAGAMHRVPDRFVPLPKAAQALRSDHIPEEDEEYFGLEDEVREMRRGQ